MVIHNDVHQKLVTVADQQGWDTDSQIIHLCAFLQEVMEPKPDYHPNMEEWQRYLEDVAKDDNREIENAEYGQPN